MSFSKGGDKRKRANDQRPQDLNFYGDHPNKYKRYSEEDRIYRRKINNRIAARKCRQKKLSKIAELEEQYSKLFREHEKLCSKSKHQHQSILEQASKIVTLEGKVAELKHLLNSACAAIERRTLEMESICHQRNSMGNDFQELQILSTVNNVVNSTFAEKKPTEHTSLASDLTLIHGLDLRMLTLCMVNFAFVPAAARLMTFWFYYYHLWTILQNLNSMNP